MRMKDLIEKRGRIAAAMREITEAPKGQGGDLSEEQATKFDELKTDLAATERAIERQKTIDDLERRMQGDQIVGSGDDRFDAELRNFSLVRAIASQVPDLADKVDCGRERELSTEVARRAGRPFKGMAVPMSVFHVAVEQRVFTTTAPGGGPGSNIIATDHLGGQFIDLLRAGLITRRLGARVLSGLTGNVDIPRLKVGATGYWVAENSAVTASDPQTDKVSLSPKHVGALVEFSRNMLLQSSPGVEQIVRGDFARLIATAIDRVALRGGGTNEPTGIMSNGNVQSYDMNAGVTWAKILDMIAEVEVDNALEGALAWAMPPKIKKLLRSTSKVTSTDSVMVMQTPTELAGYPAATTTLLRANAGSPQEGDLIFGNWADLIIGYWSELDILVNPYESTAYSKGNVQVRGMATCDVDLRHDESFIKSSNIATT